MQQLLSKRECVSDIFRGQLNAVWHVDADSTYNVNSKNGPQGSQYVVVRTLMGRGTIDLSSGDRFTLEANSLLMFKATTLRHYAATKQGWRFYWFEFDMIDPPSTMLDRVFSIRMSAQEQAELERCFTGLSSRISCECRMAEALFLYLLADWQVRSGVVNAGEISRQELLSLLDKGRCERLSVRELARQAGMCERSFRDAVQGATGLSPKAYMIKNEMEAAMELLRTTSMTITEIASCFNYVNPLYFSRAFKKYYGVSPQHVRDGIDL